jgi:hypothetical protein
MPHPPKSEFIEHERDLIRVGLSKHEVAAKYKEQQAKLGKGCAPKKEPKPKTKTKAEPKGGGKGGGIREPLPMATDQGLQRTHLV